MTYHRRHGLANRVECVDLVQLVLGAGRSDALVVLAKVENKAEQSALRLVADLLRQLVLSLSRLHDMS